MNLAWKMPRISLTSCSIQGINMKKLLYFTADWCDPCRMSSAIISDIFGTNDGVKNHYSLERINIDQEPDRVAPLGIRGVPAFIVLDENGQEISRRVGVIPKQKMLEWLSNDVPSKFRLALKAPVAMLTSVLAEKCKLGGRWDEQDFQKSCQDTIYFDPDSAVITNAAAGDLFKQLDWMKKHEGLVLLIEGHCDSKGTTEYNLMLGEKRAQAVKDFFVSHNAMSGYVREIQIVSYGKERPIIFAEHDERDRALNRRALTIIR